MLHPIRYCTFYHSNSCHVCKNPSENLKRCGNCKTLAYCSKEHQRADWKTHKDICKVIASTEEEFNGFEIKNYEDFQTLRYMRCAAWQNELKRPLENYENQMWMFPKVCVVCYSKSVIMDCQKCWNISYCSTEHQNLFADIHKKYCDALRFNFELDVHNMKEGPKPYGVGVRDIPHKVKTLPNNLPELVSLCTDTIQGKSVIERIQYVVRCDYTSPAANILFGLEKCKLLKDRLFSKRSLTVHIVGADVVEVSWHWPVLSELIFHWIKNLKALHFILIGPDIGESWTADGIDTDFCRTCKSRNVKVTCKFSSELYHNIERDLQSPDIIAVFNSGIHAYSDDIWTQSVHLLTKRKGVPLILTAYTLTELKNDVSILTRNSGNKVRVALEPQRNPFSNMKPMRDFNTFNVPVFYINGYIAILVRTVEDS